MLKGDFWQVTRNLSSSARHSYLSLRLTIEMSIDTFQIAMSKDIGTHLADIASLRDDMVVKAREMEIQEANTQTFADSMAKTWNTLSKSLTQYHEMIEKKILETSTLPSFSKPAVRAIPKNTASSSTSRAETPVLNPEEGRVYRSRAGVVQFVTSRRVCMKVSSAKYKNLSVLNNLDTGPKIWRILLNSDLLELNNLLEDKECCLYKFNEKTTEEKIACASDLRKILPIAINQWTEINE